MGRKRHLIYRKIVVAVTKADKDNGERTLTDSQIEDIAEYVEFKCKQARIVQYP